MFLPIKNHQLEHVCYRNVLENSQASTVTFNKTPIYSRMYLPWSQDLGLIWWCHGPLLHPFCYWRITNTSAHWHTHISSSQWREVHIHQNLIAATIQGKTWQKKKFKTNFHEEYTRDIHIYICYICYIYIYKYTYTKKTVCLSRDRHTHGNSKHQLCNGARRIYTHLLNLGNHKIQKRFS